MRALCALISIPDADKNIVVTEFVGQIRANSEMAQVMRFEIVTKWTVTGGIDLPTLNMNESRNLTLLSILHLSDV